MKHLILLLAVLSGLNAMAQNPKPAPAAYAIIKGHITNHIEDMWDYSEINYLEFKTLSVPVDKNGDFFKRIKIDENYKCVFFRDGNGLVVNLQKNDTILVNFDGKNAFNTIVIRASQPERDKEIQTFITLRTFENNSAEEVHNLFTNMELTDSAKFKKINRLYNKQIEILFAGGSRDNYRNSATDIYFHYASYLLQLRLLPAYDLFIEHPTENTKNNAALTNKNAYTTECDEWYKNSSEYRDFVFDYVRFFQAFNSWVTGAGNEVPYVVGLSEGYRGLAAFHTLEMSDWFTTKNILSNFDFAPFNDAVTVYKTFASKVKTPKYADTLKQFFVNIQRLKPGMPAPGFTLKDDNGKQVSLSQFRGKVVYIDFWGVGCGPCVYDIKNEYRHCMKNIWTRILYL
ncbi:TlpA disulfide reductase family protein [Mucilaginibacter sp.]|uniref:peroxiredoxin family protein n=1 Tax=Mucilaginibacter sp. TaxID=1882438 RepID=UPI0025CDB31B|nr:TlpA disulfide reductase family protein [Mucilaginibacter sp.]